MITKKPWGYFETFSINEKCTVKLITLNSGGRLSLQIHKRRDELWIALDSGLIVEIGSKKRKPALEKNSIYPKVLCTGHLLHTRHEFLRFLRAISMKMI